MATEAPEKKKQESQQTLVEKFTSDAETRLAELEPMVREAEEIRAALDRVKGNGSAPSPRSQQGQQQGQRSRRRGRRGGVDRGKEFVDLVKQNPGITVTEAAKQMKLNAPNYLYRLIPRLEEEKLVQKKDGGYHPA
jgi:hypothetical protein